MGSGVPLSLETLGTIYSKNVFLKSLDHRREKQERGDREHNHGKNGKCKCKTLSIILHNLIFKLNLFPPSLRQLADTANKVRNLFPTIFRLFLF